LGFDLIHEEGIPSLFVVALFGGGKWDVTLVGLFHGSKCIQINY